MLHEEITGANFPREDPEVLSFFLELYLRVISHVDRRQNRKFANPRATKLRATNLRANSAVVLTAIMHTLRHRRDIGREQLQQRYSEPVFRRASAQVSSSKNPEIRLAATHFLLLFVYHSDNLGCASRVKELVNQIITEGHQ